MSSHPPLSYENTRNRQHHRLISRHNTRARRPLSALLSPLTPSWLDISPSSSSSCSPRLSADSSTPATPISPSPYPRRLSGPPPPDPKRLSEEALLHALQNIRIEEEEELHLRRRSLQIVDIPLAPPEAVPNIVIPRPSAASETPLHPEATAPPRTNNATVGGTTSLKEQEAQATATPDADAPDSTAPYANCGTYQLARSKERLRDLEQQLQDTVCMMQDAVELVARRLGGPSPDPASRSPAPAGSGGPKEKQEHEKAQAMRIQQAVESMQSQLARLGKAHETTSTEHALVAGEMRSRAPEEWWEEMARVLGAAVRDQGA